MKTTEDLGDEMESAEVWSFFGQRQYSAGVLREIAVIRIVHAPDCRRKVKRKSFVNCGLTATSKACPNNFFADTNLHK
jgi:hypothetical protein